MNVIIKNVFAIVLLLTINTVVFAQTQVPQKMSYQAIVRNGSGQLVSGQAVGMQISILQGTANGTTVYVETQNPTTNVNGLVSLEIGAGTIESGNFASIDWANGPYFIKTETDVTGGTNYTISGTSQLLSVPYALHAKTAETIVGGITEVDPIYGSSIASGITNTDTAYWNNKLDSYIETDPIFNSSVASGITAVDTANWNNKLDNYTETDPIFSSSVAFGITAVDTAYWNNKLDSYTETDPIFNSSVASGITSVDTANWNNHLSQTWNLAGNSGTSSGTDFIGTTDNVPLMFKVNNQSAALIVTDGMTHFGYLAGNGNTNVNSTAIGRNALSNSNSGDLNTAVGCFSLMNTTSGGRNTSIGSESMKDNTTGNWNTSVGDNTLRFNTIGTHNSALGALALNKNTSGGANVAFGYGTLMELTTGIGNTAVGMYANKSLVGGNYNLAMGHESGYNNTSGTGNIFLGYRAGYNETGSNKLYIANNSTNPPLIYGDFATGNLGIGTDSSSARLDLGRGYGASGEKLLLYNDDFSGPLAGTKSGFYLDRFSLQNNVTFVFPTAASFPGSYIVAKKNTANTTLVPIFSILGETERVGIGTTTPSKELTVKGDAQIQTKGAWVPGAKARLYLGEDNNIWVEHIHSTGLNLNTADGWSMTFMDGLNENMRINGNGYVGIGTTNPQYNLDIFGDAGWPTTATLRVKGGVGSNGRILLADQDVTHGITSWMPTDVFGNITANSDFGGLALQGFSESASESGIELWGIIGATDPLDSKAAIQVSAHKKNGADMQALGLTETLFGIRNAFGPNNLFVVLGNGNVGIGTTSPSAKLEVDGAIKITGGTSSQFLKADGSLDANTYLTAIIEVADEFTATVSQTSFTLTQSPSTNSKVKMYINGVRISNTAYSVTGATLTYNPANNGAYAIVAGDRIQFDYSY